MLTSEQFLKHLRDALNHLYDPDRLRRSPLTSVFNVTDRFDTPSALQHILIKAIESLKPETSEPPRSHNRQVYDLLLYRYVQQFSQQEVADQLGMSVRHLRREQRAALETLAYWLWEQFDLEKRLDEEAESAAQVAEPGPIAGDDLAWLKDVPPDRPTDLSQTLPAVLELVQPLAVQHGVRLETKLAEDVPNLAVHPIALRQILLNLLTVAIHRASGGQVIIVATPEGLEVEIWVRVRPGQGDAAPAAGVDDEGVSLELACRLAEMCRCRLGFSAKGETFGATLTLPAAEQLPVLAIDDNADTIQLMQRYTTGTRYRLLGTRDLEQALSLAEQLSPQIIVLDVMMPQLDGWEVLGRLRQHPLTSHTPIIVCTILPQEELALSLDASGFVRKPITRQSFLAALDRQVAPMGPERS
ncbi:MAG: response regulator [Anaerolineae bacterium]|nr:response regulator [Anaerolineae bacterium]